MTDQQTTSNVKHTHLSANGNFQKVYDKTVKVVLFVYRLPDDQWHVGNWVGEIVTLELLGHYTFLWYNFFFE